MESECTFMFKWTFLWISGQISGRESADRTVRSLSPITMQGPHLTCVPTAQQRTSYQAVTSYLPKEWKRKKLIGPINSTKPGLRAGKKTDLLSCPKAQVLWRREFQKAPTQDSPYSWEPGVTLGSPGHFLGHHLSLSIFWNGLVHFPGCTHLTLWFRRHRNISPWFGACLRTPILTAHRKCGGLRWTCIDPQGSPSWKLFSPTRPIMFCEQLLSRSSASSEKSSKAPFLWKKVLNC